MTEAELIIKALEGNWHGGYGTAFCPSHENTKTPALSIADGDCGKLLLKCHAGCSFEAVVTALRDRGAFPSGAFSNTCGDFLGRPLCSVHVRAPKQRSERARSVWVSATQILGTPAEEYLRARFINCGLPATLGYSPWCYHPIGNFLPAMVGIVEGSDGFAVHCTFLDDQTCMKAKVDPPKIMLGPCRGGAVRLSDTDGPLAVCEGIETGLSLLSGLLPPPIRVWAALSAAGMKSLRLPDQPGKILVAADGDAAGYDCAYALAERASSLGWEVMLHPAPHGQDWNDVLRKSDKWQ